MASSGRGSAVGRRSSRSAAGWRVIQRITPPATRKRNQESPCGQRVTRGEEDGAGDRDEPEADQRPGPVAPVAEGRRGDRVLLALVGHDERGGEVDEDAGPAEEGEDDEADAVEGGVDFEVLGKAPADPGDHAIRTAALQAPDLWDLCGCVFMS